MTPTVAPPLACMIGIEGDGLSLARGEGDRAEAAAGGTRVGPVLLVRALATPGVRWRSGTSTEPEEDSGSGRTTEAATTGATGACSVGGGVGVGVGTGVEVVVDEEE
jgi:hypothetical protein